MQPRHPLPTFHSPFYQEHFTPNPDEILGQDQASVLGLLGASDHHLGGPFYHDYDQFSAPVDEMDGLDDDDYYDEEDDEKSQLAQL